MNKKHFFFKDCEERDRTVAYVQKNCKEELDHILKVADDVCLQKFQFDLRWDMEKTSKPVVFEGKINWLKMPGDDGEWIYAFNRHRYWICLGQAYAVTKDEKYVKTFTEQLKSWTQSMQRSKPENAPVWRTIEAGLRMEYWLKAFCYFEDSPLITDEVKALFYESMTDHADFINSIYNSYNLMSNWGVMANHGLFIAGVMIPETWKDVNGKVHNTKNKEYIETALSRLEEEAAIQIYDDGVQWEQSPMYHNEVLHHFLDVYILAKRNNVTLSADFEEKIHAMCRADVIWQKPNGKEFCMGDSDDIDVRDLTTKGALLFKDSFIKSGAYEHLDYETVWDVGADCAKEYDELQSIPANKNQTLYALNDSGNFYFKNCISKNNESIFHFHCGTLGAGHGHSDQLHVDLFSHNEDILVDAGRYTYVDKPERYEFKDSSAHNTVTVDGKNFYTCIDSWGNKDLVHSLNKVSNQKKNYAYAEGGFIGYNNLFINRRCINIDEDIFVINDEFYSNEKHSYEQYWHFAPQISVTKKSDNLWICQGKNSVTEIVRPSIANLNKDYSDSIYDGNVSPHYNQKEKNRVLKIQWKAEAFSSEWTVISTNSEKIEPIIVKKVPVLSNFKNGLFPDSTIEALEIEKNGRKYTIVVAHKEYASPTDTYCAGGISFDEVKKQNIQIVQPGNKTNNGVFTSWGAVNGEKGCTGLGQVTIFDRSKKESRIGTVLKV